jgi:polar amino acid transport system substrate-binding protein
MSRLRLLLLLAVLAIAATLTLAACGDDDDEPAASAPDTAAAVCTKDTLATVTPGTLTVATDSPAFPPYVIDDDPTNGQGFESAVAYAIADKLGFTTDEVT